MGEQNYTNDEIMSQLLILEELVLEIMSRLISRLDEDLSKDENFWESIRERYVQNDKGLFVHPIPKPFCDAFTEALGGKG